VLEKQEDLTKLVITTFHFKLANTIGNYCCKAEISKGYVIFGLKVH